MRSISQMVEQLKRQIPIGQASIKQQYFYSKKQIGVYNHAIKRIRMKHKYFYGPLCFDKETLKYDEEGKKTDVKMVLKSCHLFKRTSKKSF